MRKSKRFRSRRWTWHKDGFTLFIWDEPEQEGREIGRDFAVPFNDKAMGEVVKERGTLVWDNPVYYE